MEWRTIHAKILALDRKVKLQLALQTPTPIPLQRKWRWMEFVLHAASLSHHKASLRHQLRIVRFGDFPSLLFLSNF